MSKDWILYSSAEFSIVDGVTQSPPESCNSVKIHQEIPVIKTFYTGLTFLFVVFKRNAWFSHIINVVLQYCGHNMHYRQRLQNNLRDNNNREILYCHQTGCSPHSSFTEAQQGLHAQTRVTQQVTNTLKQHI